MVSPVTRCPFEDNLEPEYVACPLDPMVMTIVIESDTNQVHFVLINLIACPFNPMACAIAHHE